MDIIHLLPDSVANQIAAGEVIQRPASCLKELVENSLDAGAENIEIVIRDAGRTLLQVIDDGKGMSTTDARMAFERHATSKIQNAADLFNLHTMGFRGEALASIAAVAQVEIFTRRETDEIGTRLEIHGSEVVAQEMAQTAKGTNMKVKNLFFNVPARRRFLKTDTTEFRNILTEFYRIVLVYPQVHFTLVKDDEVVFDLPKQHLKQRIDNLFQKSQRKSIANGLVDIQAKTPLVNIYGFIGTPDNASKTPQQYFFVNGRFMKHPYFHKAIVTAYSGLLSSEQSPSYFIYFEVPPDSIDINIHPTKTEIKFSDEQSIWQILLATLREAIGKYNLTPSLDFDREGDIDIPTRTDRPTEAPTVSFNSNYNPFNEQRRTQYTPQNHTPQNWQQLYPTTQHFSSAISSDEPTDNQDLDLTMHATPVQYMNRYIALPAEDGLLLIDQHRAHLTILYSQFIKQLHTNQHAASQQVIFPESIELRAEEKLLFEQMAPALHTVGFSFTQIAPNAYAIDSVPALIGQTNPVPILQTILQNKASEQSSAKDAFNEIIALTLARTSAMSYGKQLTEIEMNSLIDQLTEIGNYRYTPDGKKIYTIITTDEINKRF